MSRRIVLASDNQHKFNEFTNILAGVCELLPQSAFQIRTPHEDGGSFEENAGLKAMHACQVSQLPAIADDSGLEVAALGGAPGIRSARYAGDHGDDVANLKKLLDAISGLDDTQLDARFYCALAYAEPNQSVPLVVSAQWQGRLLRHPAGSGGFGYDSIFYVPEYGMSAAQLDPKIKNQLSHRGQALRKLHALLETL